MSLGEWLPVAMPYNDPFSTNPLNSPYNQFVNSNPVGGIAPREILPPVDPTITQNDIMIATGSGGGVVQVPVDGGITPSDLTGQPMTSWGSRPVTSGSSSIAARDIVRDIRMGDGIATPSQPITITPSPISYWDGGAQWNTNPSSPAALGIDVTSPLSQPGTPPLGLMPGTLPLPITPQEVSAPPAYYIPPAQPLPTAPLPASASVTSNSGGAQQAASQVSASDATPTQTFNPVVMPSNPVTFPIYSGGGTQYSGGGGSGSSGGGSVPPSGPYQPQQTPIIPVSTPSGVITVTPSPTSVSPETQNATDTTGSTVKDLQDLVGKVFTLKPRNTPIAQPTQGDKGLGLLIGVAVIGMFLYALDGKKGRR